MHAIKLFLRDITDIKQVIGLRRHFGSRPFGNPEILDKLTISTPFKPFSNIRTYGHRRSLNLITQTKISREITGTSQGVNVFD